MDINTFDKIYEALRGSRGTRNGDKAQVHCPAHDDKNPSLSLGYADGKILLKCHAGCSNESVIKDLQSRGLWPTSSSSLKKVAEYIYYSEDGRKILKVERLEDGFGQKTFRQMKNENGSWKWGKPDCPVRPYTHEKGWSQSKTLFHVEGEKCVAALERLGFQATTTPGGANSWRSSFAPYYQGYDVVILPDNDDTGRKYADKVLHDIMGIAKSVKVIELPDLSDAEDVVDWLNKGGTSEDLIRLVGLAPECSFPKTIRGNVEPEKAKVSLIEFPPDDWPAPLAQEAYHGVTGELVQAIMPHTEADTAAITLQHLIAFGNLIGKGAFFPVEAGRHYANEYVVIVGRTGNGRKGSSWRQISSIYKNVEAEWAQRRIQSGMSSGEGLMYAVRDEIIREEKNKDGEFEEKIVDPGVKDKRLLVVEEEFVSVLKVGQRDGNTLSVQVRGGWDGVMFQSMVKNSPLTATGHHISIIGHITQAEYKRALSETDAVNGFANRFINVCVARSKELPHGGNIRSIDFSSIIQKLTDAKSFANNVGAMSWSPEAYSVWARVYSKLTADRYGLVGAMLARAAPHVLRLAMIYALLDLSHQIRLEHLSAALAVWEYSEQSTQCLFGKSLGDVVADQILDAVQNSPQGLSKTDIARLFNNNRDKHRIVMALKTLTELGLAHGKKISYGAGRPSEMWYAGPFKGSGPDFLTVQ